MDSNHRSLRRQIYSLLPLATREPIQGLRQTIGMPVARRGDRGIAYAVRRRCAGWSRRWDLNPQPADYKSAALPIELHRRTPNQQENGDQEGARTLDLQRDRLAF